MRMSIAFALIAALGFAGSLLADEVVKAGGPTDKPGRTLEDETVKDRYQTRGLGAFSSLLMALTSTCGLCVSGF